eukprot:14289425-Alexandrium_andersonii.AAC.1
MARLHHLVTCCIIRHVQQIPWGAAGTWVGVAPMTAVLGSRGRHREGAVSYTHLTLPTICSV